MSELKTLKDLQFPMVFNDDVCNADDICYVKRLRQEAIKWIKEIQFYQYKINNSIGLLQEVGGEQDYKFICNWLKHFFNITEEELNETAVRK